MEILYTSQENFNKFLDSLSEEFDCYVPVAHSGGKNSEAEYLCLEKYAPGTEQDLVIGRIRGTEPVKSFLNYSRERIDTPSERKQILVGIKACDLASLPIQDFVFKENDPPDPFYIQKRQNTYIISSDCDLLYENCFCTAVGNTPYPQKEFDLNISNGVNGYLIEIGSQKGRELIDKNETLFTKADQKHIEKRSRNRKEFTDELSAMVQEKGVPSFKFLKGKMKQKHSSKIWEEKAKTCIECGACNLGCPTCHCFMISDQKKGNMTARYRLWDACLYKRFAVVAGGANPRRHLAERLRNRFEKKFEFFPDVLDVYACTGCGRCFEGCPGEIDIREILKELVK